MITEVLQYIRGVRTRNWYLHLQSMETFIKYFFAHDMLNYARMMPVYLCDMKLKDSKSTVYAEFLQGNWVVNKNPLPFRAIGADHALEHINHAMKLSGGLVGITLNPSARTKFILIAPELACLAREAEEMAGYSPSSRMNYHAVSPTAELRETKNVISLCHTIKNFSNPFVGESTLLYNLVTKAIMLFYA